MLAVRVLDAPDDLAYVDVLVGKSLPDIKTGKTAEPGHTRGGTETHDGPSI